MSRKHPLSLISLRQPVQDNRSFIGFLTFDPDTATQKAYRDNKGYDCIPHKGRAAQQFEYMGRSRADKQFFQEFLNEVH